MPHNKIITTKDGSHTIKSAQFGVDYHSIHGAIQESKHAFIEAGLSPLINKADQKEINILEMGLGTGLNAFLTLLEAEHHKKSINYTALELYPIEFEMALQLNYLDLLGVDEKSHVFENIHTCEFGRAIEFNSCFKLLKLKQDLLTFTPPQKYDLFYFDAFAPEDQPELWTEEIFAKLYSFATPDASLVTYCAKGIVRRAMTASGWQVEKLPGPPGKREMLRAIKG